MDGGIAPQASSSGFIAHSNALSKSSKTKSNSLSLAQFRDSRMFLLQISSSSFVIIYPKPQDSGRMGRRGLPCRVAHDFHPIPSANWSVLQACFLLIGITCAPWRSPSK